MTFSSSSFSYIRSYTLLLLIFALLSLFTSTVHAEKFPPAPIAVNLPQATDNTRARAAATDDDARADLVQLKAGVRWMDANIGQFGATFNVTFVLVDAFTSNWQIRFHMATNGTTIKEYWGSWTLVQLPNNWYQLVPHPDLRVDPTSTVYFSFNGNWDGSKGQVTPEVLGVNAAEIQIQPRESGDAPSVRKLVPGVEFLNSPFGSDVGNAPFGNFIRSQKESKAPGVQPGGYNPPPPGPTANWLGFFICEPIFAAAVLFLTAATINRWRYRQYFRKQSQERAWTRQSASRTSATVVSDPVHAERGDLATEGGAVAEVYTYYTREQNRQSILQPGLAYRMSAYQAANEKEPWRTGLKSPPMPELPKPGFWQGNAMERVASPTLRSGTPQFPPPAMPLPRLPTPAAQDAYHQHTRNDHTNDDDHHHYEGGDLGTGGMNYRNDGRL